jgi:aerobic-type carbon monoxide dehydrogenase small subunit (CoxS/CutS family)
VRRTSRGSPAAGRSVHALGSAGQSARPNDASANARSASGDGGQQTELAVNGEHWSLVCASDETLLDTIRVRLGLTGTKRGCDRGECGACTVLLGERAVPACLRLTTTIDEPVMTVEGLAPEITDLREAFADLGAFQCGFCTPGQLVSAEACLRQAGELDDATVRSSMQGNICRCTGYSQIIEAVLAVSQAREQEHGS